MQAEVRYGNIERAIFAFSRAVIRSGILRDLKRHDFYLRPGQKKRVKHLKHLLRLKKAEQKRVKREVWENGGKRRSIKERTR